jgi:hypothetical protein
VAAETQPAKLKLNKAEMENKRAEVKPSPLQAKPETARLKPKPAKVESYSAQVNPQTAKVESKLLQVKRNTAQVKRNKAQVNPRWKITSNAALPHQPLPPPPQKGRDPSQMQHGFTGPDQPSWSAQTLAKILPILPRYWP